MVIELVESIATELEDFDHSQTSLQGAYLKLRSAFRVLAWQRPGAYNGNATEDDLMGILGTITIAVDSKRQRSWQFWRGKKRLKRALKRVDRQRNLMALPMDD
jgi:hypothetical protein